MPSYQDSIGRNAGIGDSPFTGSLRTYGCVDRAGLRDRVRVGGELARVQPSAARMAANTRTMNERVAMVSILTSSPESESPEISPGGVRGPSGELRPHGFVTPSPSEQWGEDRGIAGPVAPTYVYNRPPSSHGIQVTG